MILIADTSPLISLLLIRQLELLDKLFAKYYIPLTVWEGLEQHRDIDVFQEELAMLYGKVKQISSLYLPVSGIDRG